MEKMKELYEKVAKDSALKTKLSAILNAAAKDGQEATEAKLVAFSREAGYEVTIGEVQEFFKAMTEKGSEGLSDAELDLVAGGKSYEEKYEIWKSLATLGIGCLIDW